MTEAQQDLFGEKPFEPHFNGDDYKPERDWERLDKQIGRVFNCMKDGRWRTLNEIHEATRDPHASISAQLRHLRKDRFGGHQVEKEYIENGLYKYRLIVATNQGERHD